MFFEDVAAKQMTAFEERCRLVAPPSSSLSSYAPRSMAYLRQAFHAHAVSPRGYVDLNGLLGVLHSCSSLGDCIRVASLDPLAAACIHAALDSNGDGYVEEQDFIHGAFSLLEMEAAHLGGGRGARAEHAFRILEVIPSRDVLIFFFFSKVFLSI